MDLMRNLLFIWLIAGPIAIDVVLAWKPIVGGYASSFKLKQQHPALSVKPLGINTHELLEIPAASIAQEPQIESKSVPVTFADEGFGYSFDDNHEPTSAHGLGEDRCAVKKFAFNYDGIVKYNNVVPDMNQFTICYWMRFTNHSGDHVILTYSVKEEPREIQLWVANARNSSFMSMAIKGQQVYRLNYPLRMRQWHHACSSWNGKTGEWQVWVKGERIGRGFHNSLVSHKIPGKGKLYSGGESSTGEISPGLHFEVTFVQMYRIALSAGKAHRDHKHHHAHHFDHDGKELVPTTKPPPPINRPQPMNSLLANGQIPTRLNLNLAQPTPLPPAAGGAHVFPTVPLSPSAQPPLLIGDKQALTIHTNFVNGQINTGSRLLAEQLIGLRAGPQRRVPQATQTVSTQAIKLSDNPAEHQFIDTTETRIFFKRHTEAQQRSASTSDKQPRQAGAAGLVAQADQEKKLEKRELVVLKDGSIVDDTLLDGSLKYDGLADFGDQQFKDGLNLRMSIEDEIAEHDKEPAEEEVKAVMNLCSACDIEPFQGAIVFAWKTVVEQMDNALKGLTVGRCGNF